MWPRFESLLTRASKDDRLAGDFNMWVFVLGDLVIFAVYFFVFMLYRFHATDAFLASQEHLNLPLGTVNTLVLLTSSMLVAHAVHAARERQHERAYRLVAWAMGAGALFLALKLYEWGTEISRGHTFVSDEFFMFYFAFTGIHLVHVLLGLLVLGFVLHDLRQPTLQRVSMVETGATYWHMVDVIWVLLFAVLYLLR